MSSSDGRWGAVAIVWSAFFVAFLLVPGLCLRYSHQVGKVCKFLGLPYCNQTNGLDDDDAEYVNSTSNNTHNNVDSTQPSVFEYRYLSSKRKDQVDRIRTEGIRKCLGGFSLVLGEEHMIVDQVGINGPRACEKNISSDDGDGDDRSNTVDIEMGVQAEKVNNHDDATTVSHTKRFAHILIPTAGHTMEANTIPSQCNDAEKKEKKLKITTSKKSVVCVEMKKNEQHFTSHDNNRMIGNEATHSKSSFNASKHINKNTVITAIHSQTRKAPSCCAICLAEYELSDKICWSSNDQCIHHFHAECAIKWVVALGRMKGGHDRIPDNPSEGEVLNYEMECPCCRQEFVSKEVIRKEILSLM